MNQYLIIPGLGNSGPDHWQTFFENSASNFKRIHQREWNAPDCEDWISTIDNEVTAHDLATTILIGHSLGCSTIAHWGSRFKRKIKGALLVAPSDVESPRYTFPIKNFTPIPKEKIEFRTIVVASADDQWVSLERAKEFAMNWGSEFVNIGNAGHINTLSGHTQWPEGLVILKLLG
jgi:predicted alpha/beta hydrolase family esterase